VLAPPEPLDWQAMTEFDHPECGDDLELEGELALARGLISSGEYTHGARHAAGCLALDPLHPEVNDLLGQVREELGELAPDVIEQDPVRGYWSGEAALRAWMLRATGRTGDAVELLLQVIGADVERPWTRLLRAWLDEDPSLPLPVGPVQSCCGSVMQPMLHRDPTDQEARALVDLTAVLERALAQHPANGWLRSVASGIARRSGRAVDAVRWAEEGDRLAPSMLSACMLGYARRAAGDEAGAAAAFVVASERDPEDPSPRLDAADSFAGLGQWDSAATWAASAWRLDAELPTAAARACFATWRATGDPAHVLRLIEWVVARCPTPEPEALAALGDAVSFVADAMEHLPWTAFIPVPANAAVNIARQLEESNSGPHDKERGGPASVTFSLPEAPSALLALEHVIDGQLEVTTTQVPTPDPRVPRRPVTIQSWRLLGSRLVPGVGPPSAVALRSMRVDPSWLYTVEDVRRDAQRLVAALAVEAVDPVDLVALATHPSPGPSAVEPWEWIRRWQVVCCHGLARLGAFDTLTDLADGPEDWLTDAAVAGLVELARLQPGRQQAVLRFVEEHLLESARRLSTLDLPHFGSECDLILTIPGCPHDLARVAEELRASWIASTAE
jgi:hypothetical protein